ncbi:MAG: PD-(D/E)XK nuclease family transposase, partial [Myxococcota bacterium]
IFELRDRYTHTLLSDHFSIHLLQLSNLDRQGRPQDGDDDARVQRWARFLVAKSDAQFEQLAAEDPIMKLAKQTLEELSQEPDTRHNAWEREEALALYNKSLAASEARGVAKGRAAGVTEGMAKGMASSLVNLLGLRFGRLPDRVRVRLETATVEQLGVWTQRVLTANTPDEVFAS